MGKSEANRHYNAALLYSCSFMLICAETALHCPAYCEDHGNSAHYFYAANSRDSAFETAIEQEIVNVTQPSIRVELTQVKPRHVDAVAASARLTCAAGAGLVACKEAVKMEMS